MHDLDLTCSTLLFIRKSGQYERLAAVHLIKILAIFDPFSLHLSIEPILKDFPLSSSGTFLGYDSHRAHNHDEHNATS